MINREKDAHLVYSHIQQVSLLQYFTVSLRCFLVWRCLGEMPLTQMIAVESNYLFIVVCILNKLTFFTFSSLFKKEYLTGVIFFLQYKAMFLTSIQQYLYFGCFHFLLLDHILFLFIVLYRPHKEFFFRFQVTIIIEIF